jgi:uncharacterized protein (TIGR03435 family)
MLNHWSRVVVVAAMAVAGVSAQQPPQFEVASVKVSPPFDVQKIMAGQQRIGTRMDASRVSIDGMPMSEIINTAFRVKSYQVTAPGWIGAGMNGPRFDIHATLPAGVTTDQIPEMLQALLSERFKLTYHREKKDQSVFALIVGRGGPKLVESPRDPPASDGAPAGAPPPPGPGASGLLGRGGPPVQISGNPQTGLTVRGAGTGTMRMTMSPDGVMHLETEKVTMAMLAETLTRFLDRPVVDETGLKGSYKIALDLAREDMMNAVRAAGVALPPGALGAGPGGAGGAPGAADPSGGSIFRSVEQLGLKLDARKTPVDQLVIDHLERTPTED